MIEIRNTSHGPVQVIVRSFSERRVNAAAMTVLNIPGHQIFYVEEDRIIDTYLQRSKKDGLIKYRKVSRTEFEDIFDPGDKRMKYIPGYGHKKKNIEEN